MNGNKSLLMPVRLAAVAVRSSSGHSVNHNRSPSETVRFLPAYTGKTRYPLDMYPVTGFQSNGCRHQGPSLFTGRVRFEKILRLAQVDLQWWFYTMDIKFQEGPNRIALPKRSDLVTPSYHFRCLDSLTD